ncbi:MAG: hypothetical protein A2091_03600 [Desulfuromonadales bacterium GWD2_61_12]|nr:MAG: hypothetical protein A2091_03600 [Desulfuromonadales bacterium GWD2_61_12]
MKFFIQFPLRLTIPLFLLLCLCVLSLYTLTLGKRQADASVEKFVLAMVAQDMSRLQGRINAHRPDYDDDDIKIAIASRGSDPDVKVVLLSDAGDVVLNATNLKLPGRSLWQAVPEVSAELVSQAKRTRTGAVLLADDHQSISAYYPVVLAADTRELRPTRVGLLFMKYDLRSLKLAGHYQVEQQLWRSVLVYALILIVLGGLLHNSLTQRMRRLIATTKSFAAGDTSARASLPGRDEIARIGGAVDKMLLTIGNDRELLAENARRYRLLTENIKDVVWVLDAATLAFRYVSPSVERLRGYTPAEIMAAPLTAALTPEAADAATRLMRRRTEDFLAGKIATEHFYTDEVEQPCKDGSTVWTEVITSYYLNPANNRVEIRGVTRDIGERRTWEEQLRQRLDELQRWQDVMLDREDRVQELKGEVNALCRTLGQSLRYASQQTDPTGLEREAPPA